MWKEKYNGRFDEGITFRGTFRGEHNRPSFILTFTPFLLVTWRYFGSKQFYLKHLSSTLMVGQDADLSAELYFTLMTVILMVVIPWLLIRWVFRQSLTEYGCQLGDWPYSLKACLIFAPLLAFSSWLAASDPEFMAEYPEYGGTTRGLSVLRHTFLYLIYYACFEFHFRGFLLFGLRSTVTDWNTVLIQMVMSTLLHIGKPTGEIYGAMLGGVLFGLITIRTKSLLATIFLHWIVGIVVDLTIVYRAQ